MELKERLILKTEDWFEEKDGANGDLLDFEIEDNLPQVMIYDGQNEDFQPGEWYLQLFRQDRAERKRLQEALARAKAQQMAQARAKAEAERRPQPATAAAPTPKPASPAPGRSRSSKNEGQAVSEYFSGKQLDRGLTIETIPPVSYELITDNLKLQDVIDNLITSSVIAVDTETNGLDPYDSKLLLVQVASPEKCYIIDATKVALGPLKRLLENEQILKLLQNAKFDYEMLKQQAGIELNSVYDTYLAERLLTAGLQKEVNLAAITERYLGQKMDKSVRKTFYGPNSLTHLSDDQLAYAAKDVMVLFPIYVKQLRGLKEQKLLAVAELEFKCVMAVGDLELAGCKLDVDKWRKILAEVEQKRDAVKTELMDLLPSGAAKQSSMFGSAEYLINLNSQSQIIAEFARLNPPIILEGTSEQELNKFGDRVEIKKLLEYRSHEKTLGSFGEGLLSQIHKKTGRIHPDFLQYGADTGRFSCSNPNVQQIPATSDFRSCFIAEPGYKLVVCDYSQAELRILAELSGDPAFIEAFNSGGDLHKLAASQMFQVPVDQVTKDQRSAAKAINFGLAYGMGPQGLAVRIDKTVDEARALIDAYFEAFSGVHQWLLRMGKDSVRLRYSPTPLGRKRFYNIPDRDDPDYRRKVSEVDRQGKNAPIQGANADMTKMALVFLREKLKGYDARVVNTVHDEIVVEVREEQAEVVCKIVEAEMIRAGREVIKSVPVVADAKIGDYWSK
jgi:DNA polymerase I-like protein with 3'-5' exonuclease and polymerase domains